MAAHLLSEPQGNGFTVVLLDLTIGWQRTYFEGEEGVKILQAATAVRVTGMMMQKVGASLFRLLGYDN